MSPIRIRPEKYEELKRPGKVNTRIRNTGSENGLRAGVGVDIDTASSKLFSFMQSTRTILLDLMESTESDEAMNCHLAIQDSTFRLLKTTAIK